MKIQTIFEAFEQFRLGEDEPSQLLAWVVSGLQKVRTRSDLLHCIVTLGAAGAALCAALRLLLDIILRYVSCLGLQKVVLHIANNVQIFIHIRCDFCESLEALIKIAYFSHDVE